MAIHPQYAWRKISPDDGGIYLFGYYDRNPWNHDMSLHLAMRIPQETRLPRPGECADVGEFSCSKMQSPQIYSSHVLQM